MRIGKRKQQSYVKVFTGVGLLTVVIGFITYSQISQTNNSSAQRNSLIHASHQGKKPIWESTDDELFLKSTAKLAKIYIIAKTRFNKARSEAKKWYETIEKKEQKKVMSDLKELRLEIIAEMEAQRKADIASDYVTTWAKKLGKSKAVIQISRKYIIKLRANGKVFNAICNNYLTPNGIDCPSLEIDTV